ncbi:hypothetical protein A6J77_004315 [Aerococcus viridans]|uniref:Uncharacterized protein n=1 Tax=Aerococcus viridans TaxID=1377 RepID=A0A2J9PMC3_9LACT|nr:hypothetical protein A6J77_004315 [Aerococcus viridans]
MKNELTNLRSWEYRFLASFLCFGSKVIDCFLSSVQLMIFPDNCVIIIKKELERRRQWDENK